MLVHITQSIQLQYGRPSDLVEQELDESYVKENTVHRTLKQQVSYDGCAGMVLVQARLHAALPTSKPLC